MFAAELRTPGTMYNHDYARLTHEDAHITSLPKYVIEHKYIMRAKLNSRPAVVTTSPDTVIVGGWEAISMPWY